MLVKDELQKSSSLIEVLLPVLVNLFQKIYIKLFSGHQSTSQSSQDFSTSFPVHGQLSSHGAPGTTYPQHFGTTPSYPCPHTGNVSSLRIFYMLYTARTFVFSIKTSYKASMNSYFIFI